jgi:hypothetical protein
VEEKAFRNKVSWLMFVFSILVIWIHSYNVDVFQSLPKGLEGSGWELVEAVERLVAEGLGQAAVPGFFMLSAYLFFRGFTWEKLADKWQTRARSIVVPYIVWNLLYYIGYVLASRLPAVRGIVGKEPVPFNAAEVLNAVYSYSYAPIFWYLYQLIFLIMLSPAVYVLVRDKAYGLVYLACLLAAVYFGLDTQHPNTDALLYYSFAAYGAVHGRGFVEGRRGRLQVLTGIEGALLAAVCFLQAGRPGESVLWTVLFRLLLPASLWLLLDGARLPQTKPYMRQSLFLYAVHYGCVRFVNKGAALVLGHVLPGSLLAPAALFLFLALPFLTVLVSYGLALAFNRFCQPLWRLLSGGREL